MPRGTIWDKQKLEDFVSDTLPNWDPPDSFTTVKTERWQRDRLQPWTAFTYFVAGGIDDASAAALLIGFLSQKSSAGVLSALRSNEVGPHMVLRWGQTWCGGGAKRGAEVGPSVVLRWAQRWC